MRRPAPHHPLPRRAALAVLGLGVIGGAAGLSGCGADLPQVDLSRLDPRSDPPTPTTTRVLREPADPDREADLATLEAVYAEVLATAALVEAVSRRHRRLSAVLAPAIALHRRHAEVLEGAAPEAPAGSAPTIRSPRRAARAWALVVSTEATTQTRLAGWALDARSGTFARLLGSMSAAVAQQRSVLPAAVPAGGGR